MTQLTIRGFPNELEIKLKDLARERGWSLNKAAVHLLKKGAGLDNEASARGIGDSLSGFVGSWSEDEASAFDQRVSAVFEDVDEELWK